MSKWTFITSHGIVLSLIGQNNQITTREIALQADLTERSVLRIIKDLEIEGYIIKERVGRVNRYKIQRELPLRRQMTRDTAVGDLLNILDH